MMRLSHSLGNMANELNTFIARGMIDTVTQARVSRLLEELSEERFRTARRVVEVEKEKRKVYDGKGKV
jgi:arginine repressor